MKKLFRLLTFSVIALQLLIPSVSAAKLDEELEKSSTEIVHQTFTGIDDAITTYNDNPFSDFHVATVTSPIELIKYAITFLLSTVAIIAILFIIVGGYFYITAHGDDGQTEKGKKIIIGAVIGLMVVIASYTVVATILNFGALYSTP